MLRVSKGSCTQRNANCSRVNITRKILSKNQVDATKYGVEEKARTSPGNKLVRKGASEAGEKPVYLKHRFICREREWICNYKKRL